MEVAELLQKIKALKFSNDSQEKFWKDYLAYVVDLNKSPFSLLLRYIDGQWNLHSQHGFSAFSEQKEDILKVAIPVATRALKNSFSYERARLKDKGSIPLMATAIKLDSTGNENLVLFMFIEHENNASFKNALARLSVFSDIYYAYKKYNSYPPINNVDVEDRSDNLFKDAVEVVSLLIYHEKFLLASMTFVNELANRFNCSKVSIGWKKKEYVQAIAISHREKFTRNTEVVDKLEAVYEECFDQNKEIHYPQTDDFFDITYAHQQYLEENKTCELLSLPLRIKGEVIAVVLLEKAKEEFKEDELISLRVITNQITPILHNLYLNDRNIFSKLLYKSKGYLSWWLGVNDTLLKFFAILVFATVFYISVFDMKYKVESPGSLTTDNISYISAPFDATVYKVEVHSGDMVKKDDFLLSLDTKELYLKYSEAIADVSRYATEEQKYRSQNKLADMQISRAKINQSKATQQRIEYYLAQAEMRSPISGIIVEGNQEDLLGKPVSKGELLFKIAHLSDFYLTLNVSEEYINELENAKKGKFVFLGKTDTKIEFIIDKIIPVANVDASQTNSFIVKARFIQPADKWWRPGMSGMAKIEVGDRKIIWVLTHKLIDFFKLFFWV